jgi:hypothetical protein
MFPTYVPTLAANSVQTHESMVFRAGAYTRPHISLCVRTGHRACKPHAFMSDCMLSSYALICAGPNTDCQHRPPTRIDAVILAPTWRIMYIHLPLRSLSSSLPPSLPPSLPHAPSFKHPSLCHSFGSFPLAFSPYTAGAREIPLAHYMRDNL